MLSGSGVMGMADGPEIGQPAPDFKLQGTQQGHDIELSLQDLRGKWVVLFFFSKAFTPI
jgi:peroxiredoxin